MCAVLESRELGFELTDVTLLAFAEGALTRGD
jgi:hypothetical protein